MNLEKPRKPLTEIELAIAQELMAGHTVSEATERLVARGYHMAESTVVSRIRGIAAKVPNPHGLTPIAAIKAYMGSRAAA